MKFKSKVGVLTLLVYIAAVGVGGYFFYLSYKFYFESTLEWKMLFEIAFLVVGFLLLAYAGSAILKTYYEFQEGGLYVQSGLNKYLIPYQLIMNVKECKTFFTYNCLSADKIKISYREQGQLQRIHVSPKDKEEFLKQLKFHCKSAKFEKK